MKNKLLSVLFAMLVLPVLVSAKLPIEDHDVRGVKPTDNISSLEFNPALTVLDDGQGTSISNMTVKYYYSFGDMFSVGTEVPFARFESPNDSVNGLGDVLLSASGIKKFGKFAMGAVTEFTVPTATKDELGIGKLQFSPSLYGYYEIMPQVFISAGYKHYVSLMGDSSRENINAGRIRSVIAFLSKQNWWLLADNQYYIDYHNDNANEYILEIEAGIMLYDEMSMYIKPGWHMGGNRNTKDWSLSFGVKLLSL